MTIRFCDPWVSVLLIPPEPTNVVCQGKYTIYTRFSVESNIPRYMSTDDNWYGSVKLLQCFMVVSKHDSGLESGKDWGPVNGLKISHHTHSKSSPNTIFFSNPNLLFHWGLRCRTWVSVSSSVNVRCCGRSSCRRNHRNGALGSQNLIWWFSWLE